jgi:hypothetical protein
MMGPSHKEGVVGNVLCHGIVPFFPFGWSKLGKSRTGQMILLIN